jgi:hypothetical protein
MRDRALEEMANDPAIQLELREIEAEFAMTEFDGLAAHSGGSSVLDLLDRSDDVAGEFG